MKDNRISILLDGNDPLKESLMEAAAGDTFRLEVEGTIISKDEMRLEGIIESVYESDDDAEMKPEEESGDDDKKDDDDKGNSIGSLAFADREP